MPIVWLSEHTGFLPGPANIGLLRDGDRVITIDTGLDDGSARKILRELGPAGLRPAGIFLTHHHADHVGGAPRLIREGASLVAASPVETSLIRHPYWGPYGFCGGAHPPPVVRKKLLMPKAVDVNQEIQPGPWQPEGWELPGVEVVALAGHTPGQVGLRVDGILFCSDALLPPETWEKYGLAYFADMGRSLLTCHELASSAEGLRTMIPGHGRAIHGAREILERIEVNRKGIVDLVGRVVEILSSSTPDLTLEQILDAVLAQLGLTPVDIPEYFLNRASVQATLTYLCEQGRMEPHLHHTQLHWRLVSVS